MKRMLLETGRMVHLVAIIGWMFYDAAHSSHWTMVHQRGLGHEDLSTKPKTPPLSRTTEEPIPVANLGWGKRPV
jgi:hypothetical protein